jgi:hypothetical protein
MSLEEVILGTLGATMRKPPGIGGETRYSLAFSGSNRVETGLLGTDIAADSDLTICLWLKGGAADTREFPLGGQDDGGTADRLYVMKESTNRMKFGIGDQTMAPDYGDYDTSEWQHYAIVVDGTANTMITYMNGVEISGDASVPSGAFTAEEIFLGTLNYGGTPTNSFTGKLYDPRIYERKLTKAELRKIINLEDPTTNDPVLHYKFTEGSGTSCVDSGSGGNNGTLISSPTWDTDIPTVVTPAATSTKYSLSFSGDNFVGLPIAPQSVLGTDGDFTFSCWLKGGTASQVRMFMGSQESGGTNDRFYAQFNASNLMRVGAGDASPTATTGTYDTNNWQHVAIVYDHSDSQRLKMYIDGNEEYNTASTSVGAYSTLEMMLGTMNLGGEPYASNEFDGKMAEPRLYSDALDVADIARLIANGLPSGVTLEARYELTEGSGDKILDSSGNSYTGILIDGPTFNTDVPSVIAGTHEPFSQAASNTDTYDLGAAKIPATDDFTLEFDYVMRETLSNNTYKVLMMQYDSAAGRFLVMAANNSSGRDGIGIWSGGANPVELFTGDLTAIAEDEKHRFKVVRTGDTWELFIDGVSQGTDTASTSVEQTNFKLGDGKAWSLGAICEISNISLVNDDTSTTLIDMPLALEASDYDLVYLTPYTRAAENNDRYDSGAVGFPATDDFTLTFKYTPQETLSSSVQRYIMEQGAANSGRLGILMRNGIFGIYGVGVFFNGSSNRNLFSGTGDGQTVGTEYEFKLTRVSDTFELFVDDVSQGTFVDSSAIDGSNFVVGPPSNASTQGFIHDIKDILLVNDTTETTIVNLATVPTSGGHQSVHVQ